MHTSMPESPIPVRAAIPADDVCWQAVLGRDREYDEVFVYAVRTTGIYCRPSCPSRRPKRAHVDFHSVGEAVARGYRACKRCRPRDAEGPAADRAIRAAIEFLDTHLDENVTLERLAGEVGVSPFHLQRSFKGRVGVSPKKYQLARRLERFRSSGRQEDTVGRATYEAGFNSSRSLYEQAPRGLGMTPGRYRRRGEGLTIRYTIVDSALGRLMVAASRNGVCAVAIGDDDETLREELQTEFAHAEIARDDESMQEFAGAVARQAAGANPGLAVPVDLRGTVFQMRVWQALREIPLGETRTYAELAQAIGRPSATRAVASACAANRAALVVPCHRVVRSDGAIGGYRWGSDRKRTLIETESDER